MFVTVTTVPVFKNLINENAFSFLFSAVSRIMMLLAAPKIVRFPAVLDLRDDLQQKNYSCTNCHYGPNWEVKSFYVSDNDQAINYDKDYKQNNY